MQRCRDYNQTLGQTLPLYLKRKSWYLSQVRLHPSTFHCWTIFGCSHSCWSQVSGSDQVKMSKTLSLNDCGVVAYLPCSTRSESELLSLSFGGLDGWTAKAQQSDVFVRSREVCDLVAPGWAATQRENPDGGLQAVITPTQRRADELSTWPPRLQSRFEGICKGHAVAHNECSRSATIMCKHDYPRGECEETKSAQVIKHVVVVVVVQHWRSPMDENPLTGRDICEFTICEYWNFTFP